MRCTGWVVGLLAVAMAGTGAAQDVQVTVDPVTRYFHVAYPVPAELAKGPTVDPLIWQKNPAVVVQQSPFVRLSVGAAPWGKRKEAYPEAPAAGVVPTIVPVKEA